MSETDNPLSHLDELPDGDYKTGNYLDSYFWEGNLIFIRFDETVIIKDHQIVGFRLPNGKQIVVPLPPTDMNEEYRGFFPPLPPLE